MTAIRILTRLKLLCETLRISALLTYLSSLHGAQLLIHYNAEKCLRYSAMLTLLSTAQQSLLASLNMSKVRIPS